MTVSHLAMANYGTGCERLQGSYRSEDMVRKTSGPELEPAFGSPLSSFSELWILRVYQRHFHQVLTQEPYLQFVGAQHIAHDHVVGSVIPDFSGTIG